MLKRFITNSTTSCQAQKHHVLKTSIVPQQSFIIRRNRTTNVATPFSHNQNLPKRGLEEFVDRTLFEGKKLETAGRAWKVDELRRKSLSDLQKLWFVLYKERNMLLTMQKLAKLMRGGMTHPERIKKVAQSMARIKTIVRERQLKAQEMANVEFAQKKAQGKYKWPPELSEGYEQVVDVNRPEDQQQQQNQQQQQV